MSALNNRLNRRYIRFVYRICRERRQHRPSLIVETSFMLASPSALFSVSKETVDCKSATFLQPSAIDSQRATEIDRSSFVLSSAKTEPGVKAAVTAMAIDRKNEIVLFKMYTS